ncbi:MAG: UbiX family flavin prenyltransferase [Planctomycetaceae bacterium]|nr:UbiX family flavin prenyltransferase [Planctomycetales bacterium]MCB9875599.1 UbiX family flavin prenyltransferase [Planctomycetaceae bacterium]MCB9941676.1 UbiX family flavin prenyltransferase [Planctomycetaceae bacterium]
MSQPIVVGITGASGAVYAIRLIEVLLNAGCEVHLAISPSGRTVIAQELNLSVDLEHFSAETLLGDILRTQTLIYHHFTDFMAPIASGSFLTGGMVICPCSGTTLSSIAHAAGSNLIQRAAEVHLKERRKLILVPRETPLSLPQINNMKLATEAGAIIMPASPGWYHGVKSVNDLVDFVVCRILDQLGVKTSLMRRWGEARDQ